MCAYVCKGPQVVKFFLKINSQSPSFYAVINFLTTPTEHVWQASLSLQFLKVKGHMMFDRLLQLLIIQSSIYRLKI